MTTSITPISEPLLRQSKGLLIQLFYTAVCYQSDPFDKCEIYRYFRSERDCSPYLVTYKFIGCVKCTFILIVW